MRKSKRQLKALSALNLDLFRPESLLPPAPATLYTLIQEHARPAQQPPQLAVEPVAAVLPSVDALYLLFDRFNWMYFGGKLPRPRIEYSNRMTSAGSYTPGEKLIKIGRKYHKLFPEDLHDTLKHEIIHMLHLHHNSAFKKEAERIGASLRARSHPSLQRPPRFIYRCPGCGKEYPRQKRLRMASCGDCSHGGKYDSRFKLRLKSGKSGTRRKRGKPL